MQVKDNISGYRNHSFVVAQNANRKAMTFQGAIGADAMGFSV
jgi:hypothetical protein